MTDLHRLQKAQLEESVARDTRALIQLKLQFNAYAPISRLPSALIARILWFYMTPIWLSMAPYLTATRPYAWIQVTHVCHHWREIALRFASLWRSIVYTETTKDECVLELLARTRGFSELLVNVDGAMDLDRPSSALDVLFTQLDHARILFLDTGLTTSVKRLSLSSTEWPNLTILQLSHRHLPRLLPEIPAVFATLNTPRLESVVLYGFKIGWTHPLLRRPLVMLKLHGLNITPEAFDVLRGMPALRSLSLEGTFEVVLNVEHSCVPPHKQINLVCLQYLRLKGPSTQIAYFTSHLVLPIFTSVTLEFESNSQEVPDVAFLALVIISRLNEVAKGAVIPAHLTFGMSMDLDRWCLELCSLQPHSAPTRSFLCVAVSPPVPTAQAAIKTLLAYLPLPHIVSASIGALSTHRSRVKEELIWALQRLPNVSTLCVNAGVGAEYVAQVLRTRVEDPTRPRRKWPMIAPRLQSLTIDRGDFYNLRRRLEKSLQLRAKCGLRLQRLILTNTEGLTTEVVQDIHNRLDVETLEWDRDGDGHRDGEV